MKVYALCTECEDSWYGFSQPYKIFETIEKAKSYLESNYKDVKYSNKRYVASIDEEVTYKDTIFADDGNWHRYAIVEHELL